MKDPERETAKEVDAEGKKPRRLVVLGAPGAGKGTQAMLLANHYGIAHISTGDILRENIAAKTKIGRKVAHLIEDGSLVPDEIVIEIIKERITRPDCGLGYILDGFPRTLFQAQAFSQLAGEPERAIYVKVDDGRILERVSGRRSCPGCGAMYHLSANPPKSAGRCDHCGGPLLQREDDKAETVAKRLLVYHERTEPIIHYYDALGVLLTVDGEREINDLTRIIVEELER